ncbi:MAG: hypothetical protein AAGM22_14295 [Acidobacteriota bacterium]
MTRADDDFHDRLASENTVELYVLDRLPEDERCRFEDHFADCESCLLAVEAAQDLRDGLTALEIPEPPEASPELAEPIPFPSPSTRDRAEPSRAPIPWPVAAAIAGLALLPTLFFAARSAQLESRLAALARPHITAPSAQLELQRTSPTGAEVADATVALDPDSPWMTLELDLSDRGEEQLDLRLLLDEAVVFETRALEPPPAGPVLMTFPTDQLNPGTYRIEVDLRRGDRTEALARFRIDLTPP